MSKRFAIVALFFSVLAIGASYASAFLPGGAPNWAAWLMAIAIPAAMVAIMIVGAARSGRIGRLAFPLALVFLLVAGSLLFGLLRGDDQSRLWLGFPPAAAVILYCIGLLPLLFLPLAYALTFEDTTLSRNDLDALRSEQDRRRVA